MVTKYKEHTFRPGETINMVLRFYNGSADKERLDKLINEYNIMNNNQIPKPGITHKIPILK